MPLLAALRPISSGNASEPSPDDLPIFDREAFDGVACVLAPDLVASYLRTLIRTCDRLLCLVRDAGAARNGGGELSEAAHRLSGSAGMLGFRRLAYRAHEFECAVEHSAPDIAEMALRLGLTLETTDAAIRQRLAELVAGRGFIAKVTP